MEQSFGAYLKEKRLEKQIRLNAFAKMVGISTVYASYIESGKRPAPSRKILQNIADTLSLSPEDFDKMLTLAELSRNKSSFPENIWNYISERPYVIETLRLAVKYDVSEDQWTTFKNLIETAQRVSQPDKPAKLPL